mgnify:CR=1 FL=1|jgi:hypothetical protein
MITALNLLQGAQTHCEASQIDFICGLARLAVPVVILIQDLLVLHRSSGYHYYSGLVAQIGRLSSVLPRSYFLIADENSQQALLPLIAR